MEGLKKLLISLVTLAVCLWPLWTYLIVHSLLAPEGFWQKLIVLGVGVYFLCGFQLFFLGIAGFILYSIWLD